ncbi:UBX domain-containing protein 11 isoform X2 [Passer domesticus]|uniref:UBX domain-containing protein 11 isoform X2 n=1 Tax=Passer domesticus TaxID=48849 RepID=UPI0030FF2FDA
MAAGGAAHADAELVSSLAEKISLLEQKVEEQAREIQLKDSRIAELEEKINTLQEGEDASEPRASAELEARCLQLQRQLWEMERFLSDYGLVWVGEAREDMESVRDEEEQPAGSLCRPGEAVVCKQQIDFDLILENIKDLNSLVGEGVSQIERTARGARLRRAEPLPVTLYQNGITVGHGAFRPYQHPATQHHKQELPSRKVSPELSSKRPGALLLFQQCLQDIMDGYFPSELQPRYPDGVPLQVTDRRDVVFQKPDLPRSFPGPGQVVGTSESSRVQETSEIPGAKAPWEQAAKELSQPLKHRGSAGSARGTQGSDGQQGSKEILLEAPGLAALERVKPAEEAAAPGFCTLRVRSESGEQTYELRMLLTATIGDLRQHLAHIRGGNSDYEIISTFPQRVYTDSSRSLQECGLVPRASLLLRRRDPSQQQGRGLQPA